MRRKKSLFFYVSSSTNLLSIHDEAKFDDKLRIFYEDKVVDNVFLVVTKITNNGNTPIDEDDFKEPIQIETNDTGTILSAQIIDTNPPDIKVRIGKRKSQVSIYPLLLNPGDSINIKLIINNFDKITSVTSRIRGVKNIELDLSEKYTKSDKRLGMLFTILVFYLILGVYSFILTGFLILWIPTLTRYNFVWGILFPLVYFSLRQLTVQAIKFWGGMMKKYPKLKLT